jgi:valyl-tRNA synthetase
MCAQLANQTFLEKAPSSLIQTLKNTLSQVEKQLIELLKRLDQLEH